MIFWSMDYFIVLCCCCCCRCCCLQFFCAVRSRGLCLIFALDFAFVHTLQLAGLAEMLFGRVKLLIIRFSSFLVVFFYYYFVFYFFSFYLSLYVFFFFKFYLRLFWFVAIIFDLFDLLCIARILFGFFRLLFLVTAAIFSPIYLTL